MLIPYIIDTSFYNIGIVSFSFHLDNNFNKICDFSHTQNFTLSLFSLYIFS